MTSELLSGYYYDIGGRDIYEDRVETQQFTTAGGLNLQVAIVADGVGGRESGERAAQLAIDAVFNALKQATETDVPAILHRAVKLANQAVYAETQKNPGKREASTTLAVAVIQDKRRLFIANVGDSRVYLIRKNRVTQLTVDHTFANLMPMQGKMSRELARENPRAEVVMRALGIKPDIPVDMGFYVKTNDPQVANARGRKGLPLEEGDTILVCSDGLVKNGPGGKPYVTDEEIKRVVRTQEGEKAARSLVSFALGRDTDDNVSVALLQTPDPNRRRQAMLRDPRAIGGAIAAIALVLVIGAFIFLNRSANTRVAAAEQTRQAQSTAEAIALNATAKAQEELSAEAATATADAIETRGAATATAIAATSTASAAQLSSAADATAAAQAAAATRLAQENLCSNPAAYNYQISAQPRLNPPPPVTYVNDGDFFQVTATWTITNTGECPLYDIGLRTVLEREPATLDDNPSLAEGLPPGESTDLTIVFANPFAIQGEIDRQWEMTVSNAGNPLTLADLDRFTLQENNWVNIVEPTLTPTPTFTPTPVPPPTSPPDPDPGSGSGSGSDSEPGEQTTRDPNQ